MRPIVTPEEMAAIDRAAPEPVDVLIGRAGSAVAWEARRMLGGTYGRRVVVVAGKGNNGNDGRDAAHRLARRGVSVLLVDALAAPEVLAPADLVIDAAFGTGFHGEYDAPSPNGAPVLAVDIPSGVDGLTGRASGSPVRADRTVTFAAIKPGLLFQPGATLAGDIVVADIGLDVSAARAHHVEAVDVAAWLPARDESAHKWQHATWIVAGSPGMTGAAHLAARGAQRTGAGYVRASSPGAPPGGDAPVEVVGAPLPAEGWADAVLDGAARFRSVVIGPGLGPFVSVDDVYRVAANTPVPTVIDGDGLNALAAAHRWPLPAHVVLTPHDGEYARLAGRPVGDDRLASARALASDSNAIVLLKGPATVVAEPGGATLVVTEGDERLATAGTGDVLSGMIGALCAAGVEPFWAAAAGAFLHGRAAHLGFAHGLVAGDLPDRIPAAIESLGD